MKAWRVLPSDPVERIRCLKVLREAFRRRVKPKLQETYRKRAGKTYGPYYVAYFRRTRTYRTVRTIYLGKPNPSVKFVEWLAKQSEEKVLAVARAILSRAAGALEELHCKRASLGKVAAKLAKAVEVEDGGRVSAEAFEDLIHFVPEALELVGRWPPWFSRRLRRLIKIARRARASPPSDSGDSDPGSNSGREGIIAELKKWKAVLS